MNKEHDFCMSCVLFIGAFVYDVIQQQWLCLICLLLQSWILTALYERFCYRCQDAFLLFCQIWTVSSFIGWINFYLYFCFGANKISFDTVGIVLNGFFALTIFMMVERHKVTDIEEETPFVL